MTCEKSELVRPRFYSRTATLQSRLPQGFGGIGRRRGCYGRAWRGVKLSSVKRAV